MLIGNVSLLSTNSGNTNSGNTTTVVASQPGRRPGGDDHWGSRGMKHPSRHHHHGHKGKKRHHCGG